MNTTTSTLGVKSRTAEAQFRHNSCKAMDVVCSLLLVARRVTKRVVQEERDSFSKLLIGGGFTDAWRHQYPEVTGYTYWNFRMNARANNKGWRLDYFLVYSLAAAAPAAVGVAAPDSLPPVPPVPPPCQHIRHWCFSSGPYPQSAW